MRFEITTSWHLLATWAKTMYVQSMVSDVTLVIAARFLKCPANPHHSNQYMGIHHLPYIMNSMRPFHFN
jgi:hypothetical protein